MKNAASASNDRPTPPRGREPDVRVAPGCVRKDRACGARLGEGDHTGPHAAPVVDASWEIKDAGVAGDLKITRSRVSADVRAPAIEFSGAAETSYPPLEVALAARTIDESLAAGRPAFTEASADRDAPLAGSRGASRVGG